MKTRLLFFLCIFSNLLFAQEEFGKVQLNTLSHQLQYADKKIVMQYENDKIYYYNKNNNEKLFDKGFEVAYPFFKQAAVVQENGIYSIIDKKGNLIMSSTSKIFYVHNNSTEIQNAFFDDFSFNLDTKNKNPEQFLICYGHLINPFKKGNKWGVKKLDSIIIPPIYDKILGVSREVIIASKKHKIGLLHINGNQLTKFRYRNATYSEDRNRNICPILGLEKNGIWNYFEKGKKILKSKYRCESFYTVLENSVGIFRLDKRFNILFKNGKTLNKSYDFISENGLVGTLGNKVFLLKSDGSSTLYYEKKTN